MSTVELSTYPSVVSGVDVAGYLWEVDSDFEQPRAIIVISHGMTDSMASYHEFAAYCNARGYVVAGKDDIGHGLTAADADARGYFGPVTYRSPQIADHITQIQMLEERYPGVPVVMLGSSMGSSYLREYLTYPDCDLAAAILCASADISRFKLSVARALVDVLTLFRGPRYRSKFVERLLMGSPAKRMREDGNPFSWLTHDRAVAAQLLASPLSHFRFTLNGYTHMLLNMARVAQPEAFRLANSALPLLIVGGGDDPLIGRGKALASLARKYRAAGATAVETHAFDGDRHDPYKEVDRKAVFAYTLAWIERVLPCESAENRSTL